MNKFNNNIHIAASFIDPFVGNIPEHKLDLNELIRAIRLDLAAEQEAASTYDAHADAIDNPVAKKILTDIANEEKVHAGELIQLLNILTDGKEKELLLEGEDEVDKMESNKKTLAWINLSNILDTKKLYRTADVINNTIIR